jgi:hypothetical protein
MQTPFFNCSVDIQNKHLFASMLSKVKTLRLHLILPLDNSVPFVIYLSHLIILPAVFASFLYPAFIP